MADPRPIIDGVFAIHKPTALSSAQVLRDLQAQLNPSKIFAPAIEAEKQRRQADYAWRRKTTKNTRGPIQVKMGHGGTLDPLATGVLIVGVGNGTKSLQAFLDGTKSYEAVLVFGAATDTYDSVGKIVKRAPYDHVTKTAFEGALAKWRGPVMQKPPIFSALRVQGKRLYEYAREGIEVPVEIKQRSLQVDELELVEWMEPGTHKYHFPEQEADAEAKKVADKLLSASGDGLKDAGSEQQQKRKREQDEIDSTDHQSETESKRPRQAETTAEPANNTETPAPSTEAEKQDESSVTVEPTERAPCMAPAARIRMTVSSGFYVRSLCHDLGAEVGSLAFMAELERTRQSMFELGKNVLAYEDLEKGEDVWGPQVVRMLDEWNTLYPNGYERQSAKRQGNSDGATNAQGTNKRAQRERNSSSPEA